MRIHDPRAATFTSRQVGRDNGIVPLVGVSVVLCLSFCVSVVLCLSRFRSLSSSSLHSTSLTIGFASLPPPSLDALPRLSSAPRVLSVASQAHGRTATRRAPTPSSAYRCDYQQALDA
ncbi:hypothetical protein CALVIDRAFT_532955 [Calocera viscosa TUFC12733]|uniref:Uncharacterized protein n=1 Tax=Calocera viscosa (strain TUFC12733) TaxID=1330018 RepID=A0A167RW31_CALVF|nr:hypothetical protein CALVIDRAFT_532955 [Calocera viscosa TUFC12733]